MPGMKRTIRSLRLSLAAASLLTVAACVVNVSFDMSRDAVVDAIGTSINADLSVDLSQYSVVQEHKGNVESLSLDSTDLTVTAIGSNNQATSVSGKLALRAAGAPADGSQDVLVGQLTNFAISHGSSIHLPGNAQLDQFLLAQLKGTGQFSILVSGTTAGGPAHVTLNLTLHASLGYGTGL